MVVKFKNEVYATGEGVVFKSNTDQFSFKAVSNSYLLKKG